MRTNKPRHRDGGAYDAASAGCRLAIPSPKWRPLRKRGRIETKSRHNLSVGLAHVSGPVLPLPFIPLQLLNHPLIMSESSRSSSQVKAVTVLLEPVQLQHLELMVSRGKASSVEEVITRLIDRDRYADDTPLDGFFGKARKQPDIFGNDTADRDDGNMWDKL